MTPLLEQFLTEARDFVEQTGADLLRLERQVGDPEVLDGVFRRVHTLKGNAGLFGFRSLVEISHAAEDVLDEIREGSVEVDPDLVDCLLETMDLAGRMLASIERTEAIDASLEEDAVRLARRLRDGWLSRNDSQETSTQRGAIMPLSDWDWLRGILNSRLEAEAIASEKHLYAIHYIPEPECFFKGEDPYLTVRNCPGLLAVVVSPLEEWPPVERMEVFRCNLGFNLLSAEDEAALREHFRYVPDQTAICAVPPNALSRPPRPNPVRQSASETEGQLREILASQRRVLELTSSSETRSGRIASVGNTLNAALRFAQDQAALASLANAVSKATQHDSPEPLMEWLDEQLRCPLSAASHALVEPEQSAAESVSGVGAAEQPARVQNRTQRSADGGPHSPGEEAISVLKVPMAKVDRLMELIGEMVVAKNALPYLAAKAEQEYGAAGLAREIKLHYAVIHRIAQDMQDGIQGVRMLPVGTVFQRFPRLVRDLSRSLGKQVDLVLEGEETEVDKNIVEALADPMIHILRNSLDHGIELPSERSAAGKPPVGRLLVRADQDGDRVRILVEDDGRGIDPAVIKRKAYEKGLIDEVKLESLSDEDAVQLIFLPGFSTAESVSDLSGRGVGMDVVRRSLDRVGGTVQVSSRPGVGTSTVLSLPLSMAVSRVMIVRVCGQSFGVPLEQVIETVKIKAVNIRTIGRRRVTVLRGQVLPLYSAGQVLGLATDACHTASELSVLVARLGGEVVGLIVDGFAQAIDLIVKPLEGPLAKLPGYAGTSLMGDGSVLLILNLKELL